MTCQRACWRILTRSPSPGSELRRSILGREEWIQHGDCCRMPSIVRYPFRPCLMCLLIAGIGVTAGLRTSRKEGGRQTDDWDGLCDAYTFLGHIHLMAARDAPKVILPDPRKLFDSRFTDSADASWLRRSFQNKTCCLREHALPTSTRGSRQKPSKKLKRLCNALTRSSVQGRGWPCLSDEVSPHSLNMFRLLINARSNDGLDEPSFPGS